jgi:ferrochelatase
MSKTAVLLLNLGGPDSLKSVRPFLYNIFDDPFILPIPSGWRHLLAAFISWVRAPSAKGIYRKIGGSSPLLANTQQQAEALQNVLGDSFRIFVAMRYWHPRLREILSAMKDYNPHQVVLLPLYPQFSSTTTASALSEWERDASFVLGMRPTHIIRSYPTLPGFIRSLANSLKEALATFSHAKNIRVLFSAHGLPQYIVAKGDPYVGEVEASVAAVLKDVAPISFEWRLCYQSRIGPVRWIGPFLEDEVTRAAREGCHIIVVPIAFVSEHSETLYELDIIYRELALKRGALSYMRLPTSGIHPDFIAGLADLIRGAVPASSSVPFSRVEKAS